MVRDLAEAEGLARSDEADERRCSPRSSARSCSCRGGPARPLARRGRAAQSAGRPPAALLAAPPPAARRRGRPLVMTSGNLSDEPIAYRNDEAVARLGRHRRLFLVHDREIESRCDDSVARVVAGRAGRASALARDTCPAAIRVATPFEPPVLACGGAPEEHLLHRRRRHAPISARTSATSKTSRRCSAFEEAVERMPSASSSVRPRSSRTTCIRSTLDALRARAGRSRRRSASSITTPTWPARWPSTGSRDRSSAWPTTAPATVPTGRPGAARSCSRDATASSASATFRPIALPGGDDAAIREVWRIALALLDDAFGGEPPLGALPRLRGVASAANRARDRDDRGARIQSPAGARRRPVLRRLRIALPRPPGLAPTRDRSRSSGTSAADPGEGGAYPVRRRRRSADLARRSTCGPPCAPP